MAITITVRVSGIDLDNDNVAAELGTRFPYILWQGESEYTTATFDVDDNNAVSQTFDVARALEHTFPSLSIDRVDRDLVTVTEIASRAGVSREGARKWTKDTSFPTPFATFGDRQSVWIWSSVSSWLLETRGLDFQESLASEALLAQIDNCLHRNPDATTVEWNQLTPSKQVVPTAAASQAVVFIHEWSALTATSRATSDTSSGLLRARH